MSGSTLSNYKAAAASQIGLWLIWALMAKGSMTDSLTRISDGSWVMHVMLFSRRHLRFIVQQSKQQSWFYRSATCIMVNWTFSTSAGISKGSKCHIWILKRLEFIRKVSQHLEKLVLLLFSLQPSNLKSNIIMNFTEWAYVSSASICFQTLTITNMDL